MVILRVLAWSKRQLHLWVLTALARRLLQALSLVSALTGWQLGVLALIDTGPSVNSPQGNLSVGIVGIAAADAINWQGRLGVLATDTRIARHHDIKTLHGLLAARPADRLLIELAEQLPALLVG